MILAPRLRRLCAAFVCCLALGGPASLPAAAEEPVTFSDQAAFETAVRDYLLANPEVILEALDVYEKRQEAERDARRVSVLEGEAADYFNDASTPVMGNPEGSVTLVEFFDYRCGYCRGVAQDLIDLVEADGDIRLVMVEFPILGPESLFAARAALAAREQGRYEEMHTALMLGEGPITPATVMATAEYIGLDVAKLQADMRAPEVDETIRRSHAIARDLAIDGTPAFVVGRQVVPGAVPPETLQRLVDEQRAQAG